MSGFLTKQNLIKRIKDLSPYSASKKHWVNKRAVLDLVEQLDEQKPAIPQYVADWIEVCKENLAIGLYTAMNPDFIKQWNKSEKLISWIKGSNNQNLFARAWLDGYTVEPEKKKRYCVTMKGLNMGYSCLKTNGKGGWWFGTDENQYYSRKEFENAGFGEVFHSPLFEVVEEVEE